MGLCLQADADMFYWARNYGVGDSGKSARKVELSIGKSRIDGGFVDIDSFKVAAGVVKATELDRDLSHDAMSLR